MKKISSKKLLIAFSSLLLMVYGAITACGGWDEDWDLQSNTNITPEVFADESYAPLFLSNNFYYDNFNLDTGNLFNERMVSDWSQYLEGKMDAETVKFFLLDSSAVDVDFLFSAKTSYIHKKWEHKFPINDPKNTAFIEFLYYGKQLEKASVSHGYWDYEVAPKKIFNSEKIISQLKVIYKNTPDKYLKNRYWFQIIKAYFYSDKQTLAVDFFNNTEESVPKNDLYYRAVSYVAGIHYKSKNYALSNYLYSRVFDKSPELRIAASNSFHPQEESDWKLSLAMAKNADERAALWAIQGYYGDEKLAIENIVKLNPKSPHLDYLLARLINQQELLSDQSYKNPDGYYEESVGKIDQSSLDLIVRIANSEKTKNPYLWNLAAGYVETINKNYGKSAAYLSKAERQLPETLLAKNQLRLLQFVNKLRSMDKIDAKNEDLIFNDLKWLYEELPKDQQSKFRYVNAVNWSRQYLASLYKSQDNFIMSEFFVRDANYYSNNEHLESMKAFFKKTHFTSFETMAMKLYDIHLNDIYHYQSIVAGFGNDIPTAILLMKQTGELQFETYPGNPFNGGIKDCHDCDHDAYQKTKYNKIEFLEIIQQMQEKISKGEDVYRNYILLGNAFYNMTYFGNARAYHQSSIFGFNDSWQPLSKENEALAYSCSIAQDYYSKALLAAANDEQRAKSLYMMTKCERNNYEYGDVPFFAWNGFKTFKAKYSNTKYYQEVIAECGYFRTYLAHSK